ncbi:MAG: hypothetical protein ACOCUF_01050 [Patescibacteria group bacterium]
MEIIQIVEEINHFLEQSYLFRAFKFLLGFYLIVMFLTLLGVLFRIGRPYYTALISGADYNLTPGKFQKRWTEIEKRMDSADPDQWKAAILESAQILDEILGTIGYEGDNLGKKLDNMFPEQLRNLEEAKEANKIKNKIVKDDKYELTKEEAQKTMGIFRDSLDFFEIL